MDALIQTWMIEIIEQLKQINKKLDYLNDKTQDISIDSKQIEVNTRFR